MNAKAYIRIILTGLFSVFLGLYSSAACIGLYEAAKKASQTAADTGEISIDGADLSPFFILGGYVFSGILELIGFIVYIIIILISSIIAVLILRALLIKEASVNPAEYKISMYIILGAAVISVLVTLIMTRFSGLIPIIAFTLIWLLFLTLVYLVRLKDLSGRQNH